MFRLALVDTNVLSEVVKSVKARKAFFRYLNRTKTLPSISIWSVLELRKRQSLWDAFLSEFGDKPLVLLKAPQHVFEAEVRSYPDPDPEDVVQYVFYPGNPDPQGQLRVFMNQLFSDRSVLESEQAWAETWRSEVLEAISDLKSNFPPRGARYDMVDGERFVALGTEQWVIRNAFHWAEDAIAKDGEIAPSAFPSVRMNFWTVFFRFYDSQRYPEPSDVFDILISSLSPYVEAVMTEGFQADILRKVSRRDHLLWRLQDTMTLKDLLAGGNFA